MTVCPHWFCLGLLRPLVGVEGQVLFSDRGVDIGIKLSWYNAISAGDNGRYCEAELLDLAGARTGYPPYPFRMPHAYGCVYN